VIVSLHLCLWSLPLISSREATSRRLITLQYSIDWRARSFALETPANSSRRYQSPDPLKPARQLNLKPARQLNLTPARQDIGGWIKQDCLNATWSWIDQSFSWVKANVCWRRLACAEPEIGLVFWQDATLPIVCFRVREFQLNQSSNFLALFLSLPIAIKSFPFAQQSALYFPLASTTITPHVRQLC
jgi:hypothetical protein